MTAADADPEIVKLVIEPLLPGVDEPILEYLVSLIAEEDGGPTRPLQEEVVPFLLSAGIEGIEDEDAADSLCVKVETALRARFGGGEAGKAPNASESATSGPSMLTVAVKIGAPSDTPEKFGWGDVYGQSDAKGVFNEVWETKDLGRLKKERRALKSLQLKAVKMVVSAQQMTQLTRMMMPSYDEPYGNKDIQVDGVTLYTPAGTSLLEDARLRLTYSRRYGLIGKNGIGKTTLLKAIANQEIDGFPKSLRCLHVSQECGSSEIKVIDAVLEADVELQTLLATEKELMEKLAAAESGEDAAASAEDSARLGEVNDRLEELDAKTADSRARSLLAGLRFTEEMQNSPLSSMSGGWRVRAAIAAALFIRPEILMLDEPTNHLDLEAVLWLQDHLQTYPHTVLIVSHDRSFLNEVVTDILAVENKKLNAYKGDYNTYEKTRKDNLSNQIKEWERFVAERDHIQEFIDTFRYNAKRASLVQSRIKALDKLEEGAPPEPVDANPFTFQIPSPDQAPGTALIQLDQCGFKYPAKGDAPGREIFCEVDFSIDGGEKVGIVGPNGAGKSTMLNLLLGQLEPTSGGCRKKPSVRVASFTQHHVDSLDLCLSPIENLQRAFPGTLEQAARSWIGGYGIQGDMQSNPCTKMSGGQKSRVAFAMLAYSKPSLIVMDEPTNHLDLETIDALIEALCSFTGGIVVVTHDQHFVERVCKSLWVVGDGRVKKFPGVFKDYKKHVLKNVGK